MDFGCLYIGDTDNLTLKSVLDIKCFIFDIVYFSPFPYT